MSQALSPSFACCYGLARVARVWKISRASVYRSLKKTPANTSARLDNAGWPQVKMLTAPEPESSKRAPLGLLRGRLVGPRLGFLS